MPNSLTEILDAGVAFAAEYDGKYYLRPAKLESHWDSTVWVYDKQTGSIEYMSYPVYIIEKYDLATEIDPETIRKCS